MTPAKLSFEHCLGVKTAQFEPNMSVWHGYSQERIIEMLNFRLQRFVRAGVINQSDKFTHGSLPVGGDIFMLKNRTCAPLCGSCSKLMPRGRWFRIMRTVLRLPGIRSSSAVAELFTADPI